MKAYTTDGRDLSYSSLYSYVISSMSWQVEDNIYSSQTSKAAKASEHLCSALHEYENNWYVDLDDCDGDIRNFISDVNKKHLKWAVSCYESCIKDTFEYHITAALFYLILLMDKDMKLPDMQVKSIVDDPKGIPNTIRLAVVCVIGDTSEFGRWSIAAQIREVNAIAEAAGMDVGLYIKAYMEYWSYKSAINGKEE